MCRGEARFPSVTAQYVGPPPFLKGGPAGLLVCIGDTALWPRWHRVCSSLGHYVNRRGPIVLSLFAIKERRLLAGKMTRAQTMTEYALIMAAIAIVAIVAYMTLGTTITDLVNKVIACL